MCGFARTVRNECIKGLSSCCHRLRSNGESSEARLNTCRAIPRLAAWFIHKYCILDHCRVEQVWGVQDSIGMVPGQDPDLRAPALRAACLREISIQLQPQTAGSRRSSSFLVRELRQNSVKTPCCCLRALRRPKLMVAYFNVQMAPRYLLFRLLKTRALTTYRYARRLVPTTCYYC